MKQRYLSYARGLMVCAVVGVVSMVMSGCSDSTVAPRENGAVARSGHGGAFDIRVSGGSLASTRLAITMTPTPHEAVGPEDSRQTIGEYTGGKIIVAYDDATGAHVKKMARVSVNNRTGAILYDGREVSTLGEMFQAVTGEVDANDTVAVCAYFENYIGIDVDPAYSLDEVAALSDFSAIEPAALDSVKPPAKCYVTDKGTKVPHTEDGYPGQPDWTEKEACDWLIRNNLKDKVTEVGGPTDTTNCHGWTFTCGKDWLGDSASIRKILEDNGYKEVKAPDTPQPGDVVIYKDSLGRITHSGIVRAKPGGGFKIESKWGRLGRYCHEPGDVPKSYGTPCYYRTDRPAPPGSTDPDKDKHVIKTM